MGRYVSSIRATGIYNRFDIATVRFGPGLNIIHGRNGSGKTTLLHILANAMNGDFARFKSLRFAEIEIGIDEAELVSFRRSRSSTGERIQVWHDGDLVYATEVRSPDWRAVESPEDGPSLSRVELDYSSAMLERMSELESAERPERLAGEDDSPLISTAYYPAFRTMLEASASARESSTGGYRPRAREPEATRLAREWFGGFVPLVNFPSLERIESGIASELRQASATVWQQDRVLLTGAFREILQALSRRNSTPDQKPERVLSEIRGVFDRLERSPLREFSLLLTGMYDELREEVNKTQPSEEATAVRVLAVYQRMLSKIAAVQEGAFRAIEQYLSSVNAFLEGKSLAVSLKDVRRRHMVGVKFTNGSEIAGLRALSSGERQIATLMYAATHMSRQKLVLIDEPEISLHVDWQVILLKRMAEQLGDRQIIACTHSPIIAEDYEDRLIRLEFRPSTEPDHESDGPEESSSSIEEVVP